MKKRTFFINLTLAAIIAMLYFTLISPYAVETTAMGSFPIYKGGRRDCVALQCTVTWDAAALEDILSTLSSRGVHITFTVSGEWVEGNPTMLKRIYDEGHEIATMGYDPDDDGRLNLVKSDIERSLRIIEGITGHAPTIYYCGNRNTSVSSRAADGLGLTTVLCTLDLICANGTETDIIERVRGNTNGGDILLASPTAAFSRALTYILDYFSSAGLTVGTVSSTIYS